MFMKFAGACSCLRLSLCQDHFYELEAHYEKHDPILNVEVYDYDILSSDDLIGKNQPKATSTFEQLFKMHH